MTEELMKSKFVRVAIISESTEQIPFKLSIVASSGPYSKEFYDFLEKRL